MLRVFDSVNHRGHAGAKEMRYDQMSPMCESPDRMDTFLAALRGQGHSEIVDARRFDLAPALRLHTPGFWALMQRCWPLWAAEFGSGRFAKDARSCYQRAPPVIWMFSAVMPRASSRHR